MIVTVFVSLCSLPYFFTLPGKIDFSGTGQIGDTIGGIMGPFVAIIAAFLTFIAFWVQYQANIKQREDISIERQEAKYYKMLSIYSEMSNGVEINGIKGKEAFAELVGEFTYSYHLLDTIYHTLLCAPTFLAREDKNVQNIVKQLNKDREDCNMFILNLSYNLFFYGKHFMIVDPNHPELTALGETIKRIVFSLNSLSGSKSFIDYVKEGDFTLDLSKFGDYHRLFSGHSDFLGHYFRLLYQTVKYVASLDDNVFNENAKSSYVKLLRAQMSDYEQILLYYNSLSEMGAAWNKSHGERFPEDSGYICRFRLIKNIPPNFPMFGVIPPVKYREEIRKWKELGKKFFEHSFLPVSRDAIHTR